VGNGSGNLEYRTGNKFAEAPKRMKRDVTKKREIETMLQNELSSAVLKAVVTATAVIMTRDLYGVELLDE
jgi:ribosome-binding factor A